jgi:hypothetical protein
MKKSEEPKKTFLLKTFQRKLPHATLHPLLLHWIAGIVRIPPAYAQNKK